MSINITIRVAKSADHDAVLKFIREHYYKEEPITISHPEPGHTVDDEIFSMSHIEHDTILMAFNSDNDEIVGILIAGPIELGDADVMLEDAKKASKKWGDILRLLAYIEKKADVLGRFNLDTVLHCHVLTSHKKYRGNGIGQKLFEYCFENARNLNYKLMSTDCTSIFTTKIAEKCGMECISTVTYDEYNELLGERLFQPQEPNFEIKTFVKKL
ncbi:arylalkylamine N-acetyltransferase-like 2 [Chironomus tepperi]|uniref:arylalkylamine N-acetyltransferase-like 2 n=1 Tax=Chironomus tepperi TaxID=113505 RepID=UPI00391FC503